MLKVCRDYTLCFIAILIGAKLISDGLLTYTILEVYKKIAVSASIVAVWVAARGHVNRVQTAPSNTFCWMAAQWVTLIFQVIIHSTFYFEPVAGLIEMLPGHEKPTDLLMWFLTELHDQSLARGLPLALGVSSIAVFLCMRLFYGMSAWAQSLAEEKQIAKRF